jgi:hypothetical protein
MISEHACSATCQKIPVNLIDCTNQPTTFDARTLKLPGLCSGGCFGKNCAYECRNSSTVALAVTGLAFPLRTSATNAGLYARCASGGSR